MTKKTSYLLGIGATILIGTILYYYLCCNCKNDNQSLPEVAAVKPIENSNLSTFSIDGKDFSHKNFGSFNFKNSDFNAILPVNDSINFGIEKLKGFLMKNDQRVSITGYALSTEKNTSAFENLGFARANNIKNYFVSKGVSSDLIDINGIVKEDLNIKDTTIYGPVSINVAEANAETPTIDWTGVKAKLNANTLILYFNTGQASIDLSVSDRKKITEITRYLDNVEGSKLDVVGHTDNVGDKTKNTKLGLDRADFAKKYLASNGISNDRIASSSKGPDEPIADNTTKKGKAKNRRVEVKIN
jgi:OmpA-OmpF porin, OOP family